MLIIILIFFLGGGVINKKLIMSGKRFVSQYISIFKQYKAILTGVNVPVTAYDIVQCGSLSGNSNQYTTAKKK